MLQIGMHLCVLPCQFSNKQGYEIGLYMMNLATDHIYDS